MFIHFICQFSFSLSDIFFNNIWVTWLVCPSLMGFNFHAGVRVWQIGCVHAAIPEAFDAVCPVGLSRRRDKSSV